MNKTDGRKQAVSLRMTGGDLRKVKRLSASLGVNDSEVLRFAVRMMLARLALLCDGSTRGRALLPVFMEFGPELFRHFDLDEARLEAILNDGAAEEMRVDPHDIRLLAMSHVQGRLSRFAFDDSPAPGPRAAFDGHGALRRYLYDKYVEPNVAGTRGAKG